MQLAVSFSMWLISFLSLLILVGICGEIQMHCSKPFCLLRFPLKSKWLFFWPYMWLCLYLACYSSLEAFNTVSFNCNMTKGVAFLILPIWCFMCLLYLNLHLFHYIWVNFFFGCIENIFYAFSTEFSFFSAYKSKVWSFLGVPKISSVTHKIKKSFSLTKWSNSSLFSTPDILLST